MLPAWRIFYDDGSTFDSLDGEPHEAPTEGFVACVGYDETGSRYIQHAWDFYHFDLESNCWWGCDRYGLHDRLRRNLIYAYKEGRTVSKTLFREIMARADADPQFPIGGRT